MFVHVPLNMPRDPGYFRWQRVTKKASLPSSMRGLVPLLNAGESYYVPIGGPFGFSAGSIQYPHRSDAVVAEIPIGDVVEDGIALSCAFLADIWIGPEAPRRSVMVTDGHVLAELGKYRTNPDGTQMWVHGPTRTCAADNTVTISEAEVAAQQSTHLRIVHASIFPTLVVSALAAPNWKPVFVAPMCVVGIE